MAEESPDAAAQAKAHIAEVEGDEASPEPLFQLGPDPALLTDAPESSQADADAEEPTFPFWLIPACAIALVGVGGLWAWSTSAPRGTPVPLSALAAALIEQSGVNFRRACFLSGSTEADQLLERARLRCQPLEQLPVATHPPEPVILTEVLPQAGTSPPPPVVADPCVAQCSTTHTACVEGCSPAEAPCPQQCMAARGKCRLRCLSAN